MTHLQAAQRKTPPPAVYGFGVGTIAGGILVALLFHTIAAGILMSIMGCFVIAIAYLAALISGPRAVLLFEKPDDDRDGAGTVPAPLRDGGPQ